jgi:hypothetical protein
MPQKLITLPFLFFLLLPTRVEAQRPEGSTCNWIIDGDKWYKLNK